MVIKPLPDDEDVESLEKTFIRKGGAPSINKKTIQKQVEQSEEEWTSITIRLPTVLLKALDDKRQKQIGISRNAWMLNLLQKSL